MDQQIEKLQDLINESKFTLVITGAGISVASGIASMHGLNMADTFQFASTIVLKATPEHYYRVSRRSFLDAIFNNGPSFAHKKMAELEKKGKLQGVITTNIDGLHSPAGSKNVAEIQGSFHVNKCLSCGKRNDDICIWNQGKAPRCNCGGLMCSFPVYAHVGVLEEEVSKSRNWAGNAELVIIVGAIGNYSSVYFNYINPSAKIVQINPAKTQFDSLAEINIHKTADAVFEKIS